MTGEPLVRRAHRPGLSLLTPLAVLLLATPVARPQPAPGQEKWITLAPLPQPQAESGAAAIDGRIYVIGGLGKGGSEPPFTLVQVSDVGSHQWSEGTSPAHPGRPAGGARSGGQS